MSKSNKSVCFYFQVHQPLRLSRLKFFEKEKNNNYFLSDKKNSNKFFIEKVGRKSYHPTNKIILKLLKKYPEFRVSYSISGVALEQFLEYDSTIIDSFQELVSTGRVELLNETYYHSLAWMFSKSEFVEQVAQHRSIIWKTFHKKPKTFRNTELIYNNELANFVRNLGFETIVAEGWDKYLVNKSPNYVYQAPTFALSSADKKLVEANKFTKEINPNINVLLKNYKLSDDVAFRFSDQTWGEHPLTVEKFADWIEQAEGETINLFMDYETFGEHQWETSGIFRFLERLPQELLSRGITFATPSETVKKYENQGKIDIHELVSWADMERDLSAWLGNNMQMEAATHIYECEKLLDNLLIRTKGAKHRKLIDTWRKLQTSDHFYYMSTKYWSDGDIHKYFSPYDSPYDAYINYMNVLNDFKLELQKISL